MINKKDSNHLSELEHVSYLFEHYSTIKSGKLNYEYLGKDNKPSKTFILETDIDGETIVTIEAVQENKTKLIRVLTEYKKKTDKSLSTSKRTSADAQSELIESSK